MRPPSLVTVLDQAEYKDNPILPDWQKVLVGSRAGLAAWPWRWHSALSAMMFATPMKEGALGLPVLGRDPDRHRKHTVSARWVVRLICRPTADARRALAWFERMKPHCRDSGEGKSADENFSEDLHLSQAHSDFYFRRYSAAGRRFSRGLVRRPAECLSACQRWICLSQAIRSSIHYAIDDVDYRLALLVAQRRAVESPSRRRCTRCLLSGRASSELARTNGARWMTPGQSAEVHTFAVFPRPVPRR